MVMRGFGCEEQVNLKMFPLKGAHLPEFMAEHTQTREKKVVKLANFSWAVLFLFDKHLNR